MTTKTTYLKYIFQIFIFIGVSLSVINFINFRSLWIDEAMLSLNIVHKPMFELLKPLDYNQVAPIGFLLLEKFFAFLFDNTDWSLRIFPMVSFFISVYLMYLLTYRVIKEKNFALFATAFYSLSYSILSYSSEVKQYMSDVMFCLIILLSTVIFTEKKDKKYLWVYALVGIISIWFSNISIILLFTSCLYFIYNIHEKEKNKLILFIMSSWIISFAIYYLLFIHQHPTKNMMLDFWDNAGGFLPQNIFSKEFYIGLFFKIYEFFKLVGYSKFSVVLFPVFCMGLIFLVINKRGVLFLFTFPVILHLFLSYFKMYPFHSRLILYLYPILLVIICYGIYYLYTLLKKKEFYCFLLIIPLISNLIVLDVRGFPIEKEEIKKSLSYLNIEKKIEDNIYVYYGASPAFLFYKSEYPKILNTDSANIIFAKSNRKSWDKYEKEIKQIRGTVWIVFSHTYWEKNQNGLDEKEYILNLFKKNNFQIIEEQNYKGSSVYKAISTTSTPHSYLH